MIHSVPKPPKGPPKARQHNSSLPRPTKKLASSGRIAPKKRKPSEFARVYGSRARVAWIKQMPCVYCVAVHPVFAVVEGRSENAHTVTDGMGRKADYDTIVPLCHSHHTKYDQHEAPFDDEALREKIKAAAKRVERAWREYCGEIL